MQVFTNPVVETKTIMDEERQQVSFVAYPVGGGNHVRYLTTKGLEHYGPSLYDMPMYMNLKELRDDS